jgi:hypothetical protein
MVWAWFGHGLGMVWAWFGHGLGMIRGGLQKTVKNNFNFNSLITQLV